MMENDAKNGNNIILMIKLYLNGNIFIINKL